MEKKKVSGKIIAIIVLIAVIIVGVVVGVVLMGKKKNSYRLVKVQSYTGNVTIERDKKNKNIFEGIKLIPDDVVTTFDDSFVELLVDSDKHIGADANTSFKISAVGSEKAGKVRIELLHGSALFTIDNKLNDASTFKVKTPNATLSVRGTIFRVEYDEASNVTSVSVKEGTVAVTGASGEDYLLEAGKSGKITGDGVFTPDDGTSVEDTESGDTTKEDDNTVINSDNPGSTGGNSSEIVKAYNDLIANMDSFIASSGRETNDYVQKDYMYYDYNGDGIKEVILYLGYFKGDEYCRDIWFLYYNNDTKKVDTLAVNYSDVDAAMYYADYNGKLARYSWRTDPYESYIYYINVDASGSLSYVLDASFDEIISDPADINLTPLPLYGDWEMIFED